MHASVRLGILLVTTLTTAAGAQNAPIAGPGSSEVRAVAARGPLRQPLAIDSVRSDIRPTHWRTGALIGGLTTGLGLALLANAWCNADSPCGEGAVPFVFLAGGAVGGLIGALIGGQFPKEEDP